MTIAISLGISAIVTCIIAASFIKIRQKLRQNKTVISLDDNQSNQNYSDLENPSLGSKEELIIHQSKSQHPPDQIVSPKVVPPLLYKELGFPKSSNCGSMRKKREAHFEDMINVYSITIKQNLTMNDNDVVRSKVYV